VGCDFLNFVFVYDEFADVLDKDGARQQADIVMDALRNPHKPRPQGESLIGEIAQQYVPIPSRRIEGSLAADHMHVGIRFWVRAVSTVEPGSACLHNFVSEFDAYTAAVIRGMEDHRGKSVRNVTDYLALRRDTCGVASTLAIVEFGLDLPDHVLKHPIVVSLREGAIKLIGIINVC
jgi:Delta6-protoilludene synthase